MVATEKKSIFVETGERRSICFIRVSRESQGLEKTDKSTGLGAESQRRQYEEWRMKNNYEHVDKFEQCESAGDGTEENVELMRAIGMARRTRATIVVANISRASRNLREWVNLIEPSGVPFICLNAPVQYSHDGLLFLRQMILWGEWEREQTRARVKHAMKVLKDNGVLLGSNREGAPQLTREAIDKGRAQSIIVRRRNAEIWWDDLKPEIVEMRKKGMGMGAIAKVMREKGEKTRRGKDWSHTTVRDLLKRWKMPMRIRIKK